MKIQLTVAVLTKNEAVHIARVINNVKGWADNIIVLDSYSDDDTAVIATNLGAQVLFRKFDDYKNQRQYLIEYCKDSTEWLLFLDADEYLLEELKHEIKLVLANQNIDGYYMSRRVIFMGKWIKYGGYYPTYLLRLFRPKLASIDRDINEHVKVNGTISKLKHDFVDQNLKGTHCWIEKHNQYATREARATLIAKMHKNEKFYIKGLFTRIQSDRKKWLRVHIWNNLPLLIKPFIYFGYRYFLRFGFLDGREGLIYHFLQGCWFPMLIDVKYLETITNNTTTKQN